MANEINSFLARFQNEPALMRVDQSMWLQAACQAIASKEGEFAKIQANDDFWGDDEGYYSYYRPYKVKDGILTIPVKGLLLNDFPYALGNWATGYDYIWEAVKRGMDDSEVKGIVFAVESGGGMVSGNFDLVDRIYAKRGVKAMWAITMDAAYSAAYSIASVADRIIMGRTAGVGSIGVVTIHSEISKSLDERGVTINIVRSKPRKMEGNSYEPLTDEARNSMQERVDAMHEQFVAIVARNRGMDAEAVDGTDALCFMHEEAIERGLADEMATADDAITAFAASFNTTRKDYDMAEELKATITEEAHAAAVAKATTDGRAEGATAERARISAILSSDEAKARPAAAQMFAFDLDLPAADAVAKLGKLPAEAKVEEPKKPETQGAGAGAAAFTDAMNKTKNPDLAAEGDENGDKPSRVQATLGLAFGERKTA